MIINATNIGENLTGIGRYSLSISLYFLEHWDYPFQLFINNRASVHFKEVQNKNKIKLVSGYISPDLGFKGHLPRLLWVNKLSLQNQKEVIFNTSQLEGCLYHKKQIITVHDLIPLIFPRQHPRQYHYFKYLLPIILKRNIEIITVSDYTKDLLIDLYKIHKQRIFVIRNGISEHFLNCKLNSQKQNYILYIGKLSPTKNIKGLIKAFEILVNIYNLDLKLKLTGYIEKLYFEIDNKIKNKVEFIGFPCDNDLLDLYRNALLFVFPSLSEGFGLPPLEAMACGCPVVVSNVASLPEVCGDAAYYVDPYNVESIADGIYKVLTNETLRQGMIQKGIERAKLFSWEKSAEEHLKVFEEVLNS